MRSGIRDAAIIVVIASVVLFTNLGVARLWDRDEPRNAGCAAEMLERGDYVVPYFNAELRDHKPILLYWFIMAGYSMFGINEFGARFWSAVLAIGTTLLTYGIGRRIFHREAGLWAAIVLSTCLMFDVAGRAATPDSPLIFFSTLAIFCYVMFSFPKRDGTTKSPLDEEYPQIAEPWFSKAWFPKAWFAAAVMYGVMGIAMLAKGPVGLILPTAVIGMFLLIMWLPRNELTATKVASSKGETGRSWFSWFVGLLRPFHPIHFLQTCWKMRPITALAISLAIAAPWYILVGLRTEGAFLDGFFLTHNLERATSTMEGHRGNALFYPLAMLFGFFPWSIFTGAIFIGAVSRIRSNDRWQPGYIFACCWVAVYVGVFSLAATKLPSYVTPCYPALALLAGGFLYHWTREESRAPRIWPRLSFICLGLVGLGFAIGLPLAANKFLPGDEWLGIVGAIPIVGAACCWWLYETKRTRLAAMTMSVTAALFATVLFGVATVRLDQHQKNDELLAAIENSSEAPRVGAFGCLEPTWIFYGGRPIHELQTPEQAALAKAKNAYFRKPISPAEFFSKPGDGFVITTKSAFEKHREAFPVDLEVIAESPYFLKNGDLIVVRPRTRVARKGSRNNK
jgi:4-amino-4-deoxy-L-arabinose transferase-like glycosyltransferase